MESISAMKSGCGIIVEENGNEHRGKTKQTNNKTKQHPTNSPRGKKKIDTPGLISHHDKANICRDTCHHSF